MEVHEKAAGRLLAAIVVVSSCLLAGGLPQAPGDDIRMHFWDTRCMPLAYREWSYVGKGPPDLGSIPFRTKNRALHEALPASDTIDLMLKDPKLVVLPIGSLWVDRKERVTDARDTSTLRLMLAASMDDLFLHHRVLSYKYGTPWYEFESFDVWSFYKRDFDETLIEFAGLGFLPAQLSADALHIAFTHESQPGTRRKAVIVDITRKSPIALSSGAKQCGSDEEDMWDMSPVVVSPWTVVSRYDTRRNKSSVWLHNLDDSSYDSLGYAYHGKRTAFHGMLWNTSKTFDAPTNVVAAWLEAPLNVTFRMHHMHSGGVGILPTSLADLETLFLSTVDLPSRSRCTVPPSQWQQPSLPRLRGVVGGGQWIFLALSSRDGSHWAVALRSALAADCEDKTIIVPGSDSLSPIRLLSGFHNGAIFTVGPAGDEQHWVVRVQGGTIEALQVLVCKLFDFVPPGSPFTKRLGEVAMLDDLLIYQYKEDDGTVTMYRADLDKDNDLSWDAVDRFPLQELFRNDSDNDGIGDAADILRNRGDCSQHLEWDPGECMGDTAILYIVWGCTTFVGVIVVASIGRHNQRRRDKLVFQKKVTTEEWLNRQWHETSRQDIPEEELFKVMAELDDRIQRARGLRDGGVTRLETTAQGTLFLLTIISVGLWIASMWNRAGLSPSGEAIMAWIDFFTSTVFLVDLVYRWVFREEGEYNGFCDYCIQNWYDFPSLITDIPGATTAGTLNILVIARLIRLLRVLKMFRVVRLYHKLTQQQAVLGLILRYDSLWQTIFVCGLILSIGIILKLIEQDYQEEFEAYENVLWFCIVTVTTIGYGDMVPEAAGSRVLAVLLMVSGIGIIGVLTATMGDMVRFSGVDKDMMADRLRRMRQGKWRLRLEVLRNSVMYNPVLTIFTPYQRGRCSSPHCAVPGKVMENCVGNVKVTYGEHKFHISCFRCYGCGKECEGLAGPCWVVVASTPSNAGSLTHSTMRDWVEKRTSYEVCPHQIYLHKICLLRARGVDDELYESSSLSSSVPSEPSERERVQKEEYLDVEELNVMGLTNSASQYNGTYLRRPALDDSESPLFDHVNEEATISLEGGKWLLLVRSGLLETEVAGNERLLGEWTVVKKDHGSPIVEDAATQLHYWHIIYDPLDVPIRSLIINYASVRTKQQFARLTDNLEHTDFIGGGKFGGVARKRDLDRIAQMDRIRHQIKVVTDMEERRAALRFSCNPMDRLELILKTHKLNENDKVKNYELMKDHLEYVVFFKSGVKTHNLTIAKLFSIKAALDMSEVIDDEGSTVSGVVDWGQWDEEEYDWTDATEWKLWEVDKILHEHGVDRLDAFSSIRVELEHLVLSYDRVLTCKWAWTNLSWKRWEEQAERPFRQQNKTANMPEVGIGRTQYCDEEESFVLDPLAAELEMHQRETGKRKAAEETSAVLHHHHHHSHPSQNTARRMSIMDCSAIGVDGKKLTRQGLPG